MYLLVKYDQRFHPLITTGTWFSLFSRDFKIKNWLPFFSFLFHCYSHLSSSCIAAYTHKDTTQICTYIHTYTFKIQSTKISAQTTSLRNSQPLSLSLPLCLFLYLTYILFFVYNFQKKKRHESSDSANTHLGFHPPFVFSSNLCKSGPSSFFNFWPGSPHRETTLFSNFFGNGSSFSR